MPNFFPLISFVLEKDGWNLDSSAQSGKTDKRFVPKHLETGEQVKIPPGLRGRRRRRRRCGRWHCQWMSRHMGRLTKMKTLNSMRMEKQRKMAYRMRQARPSRQSRVHLFKWTPRTCRHEQNRAEHDQQEKTHIVKMNTNLGNVCSPYCVQLLYKVHDFQRVQSQIAWNKEKSMIMYLLQIFQRKWLLYAVPSTTLTAGGALNVSSTLLRAMRQDEQMDG